MGKKMKLPFLFKPTTEATAASSSWPWPSCGKPKTLSFRAGADVIFKSINSAYLADGSATATDSPESEIFSGELEEEEIGGGCGEDSMERVIRGLRSGERLFFEPEETSSIVDGIGIKSQRDGFGLMMKERSVVMAMESEEPHVDFKRSMEEMVEGHGLKDWESLQELLSLYLKLNAKNNYGYIVGAFVDLLLGLNFPPPPAPPCYCNCNHSSYSSSSSSSSSSSFSSSLVKVVQSPTSPFSFSSSTSSVSPCLSSLEAEVQSEKSSR